MTEQELNTACEWLKDQMHIGSPEKTGNIYATTFLSVTPDFLGEFRKAMGAIVKESLTPELTWHKASEELPEEDDAYYVAGVGFYDKANWCKGEWQNFPAPITHWMEIPEIKED